MRGRKQIKKVRPTEKIRERTNKETGKFRAPLRGTFAQWLFSHYPNVLTARREREEQPRSRRDGRNDISQTPISPRVAQASRDLLARARAPEFQTGSPSSASPSSPAGTRTGKANAADQEPAASSGVAKRLSAARPPDRRRRQAREKNQLVIADVAAIS